MNKRIKSIVLFASLLLNLAFALLIFRRSKAVQPNQYYTASILDSMKRSISDSLEIKSSDIVFAGNSLTEMFPLREMFPDLPVKNKGIGGNETIHLLHRIASICSQHPKQLFIEIGVNDILNLVPVDSVIKNYDSILSVVKQYSIPVFVQSLLPVNHHHERFNGTILEANDRLKDLCNRRNIAFIDLFSYMSKGGKLDPSFTVDGLHLNYHGYGVWKSVIKTYLK